MDESEYQKLIPIFCKRQSIEEHKEMLYCWSVLYGYTAKSRGSEGPQYCHDCNLSCRARRLEKNGMIDFFKGGA
jgi:hypothetical protein